MSWLERALVLFHSVLLTLCSATCQGVASPLERHEFRQAHMGTLFKIILYSPTRSLRAEGLKQLSTELNNSKRS